MKGLISGTFADSLAEANDSDILRQKGMALDRLRSGIMPARVPRPT